MKPLFLLLLIILLSTPSVASNSCEKPYVVQVGPELTSDFMVGYLGGFTLAVAQNMGCGTRIKGTKDYESFIRSALNKDANIYLIPEHFISAFVKRGFVPVLQQQAPSELLFITSIENIKQSDYGSTLPLNLYTPSIFSIDYMLLNDWLKNTLGKTYINYEFNHTYPSVVLKTMETSNTMSSIPKEIFSRLPTNIQDNLHIEKSGVTIGGYIVISENHQPKLKKAIIDSKSHLKTNQWSEMITTKDSPYSQRFESLIQNLEKSTK